MAEMKKQLIEKGKQVKAQAVALAAIPKASVPATLKKVPALPAPSLPADPLIVNAMQVVRSGFVLLDMQDSPVAVTWSELLSQHFSWATFCTLVPWEIIGETEPPFAKDAGPSPQHTVPQRLLGCLRSQLNELATQEVWRTAQQASVEAVQEEASAFAHKCLDQAIRMQNRKRLAASPEADNTKREKSAPDTTAASTEVAADAAATAAEAAAAAAAPPATA